MELACFTHFCVQGFSSTESDCRDWLPVPRLPSQSQFSQSQFSQSQFSQSQLSQSQFSQSQLSQSQFSLASFGLEQDDPVFLQATGAGMTDS